MSMLHHISVDEIRDIAHLAGEARAAQDRLLNKRHGADRAEDDPLIETEALATFEPLDAGLGNPALDALKERLSSLSLGALRELIAVMSIGRGDFSTAEWESALDQAAGSVDAGTVDTFAEKTLLHDYLLKGLYHLKLS